MDKLDLIFDMQKKLDRDIEAKRSLPVLSREEWIQKEVLAIIAELGELLDETNYKWWKNPKQIDDGALFEEIVDVLHFYISLCYRAGLDADRLFEVYMKKNKENFNRQAGLSNKQGYAVSKE